MIPADADTLVLAVPVYNGERFLTETLASLNAQGDSVRWWLQDGNSTDATVEIARKHARPRDRVVSEADRGQADALNKAFRQMGGDFIGFLNADDLLLPGTARTVLDFFQSNPHVDLVCGGVEWIDETGESTGHHNGEVQSLADVMDIYRVWWADRQWVQPEVFYRRPLWEKVGGFDVTRNLTFDYEFWIRCFRAGARVAHLPHRFCKFRRHPAQKSAASLEAAAEIRAIVRQHLDDGIDLPSLRRWRLEADRRVATACGTASRAAPEGSN